MRHECIVCGEKTSRPIAAALDHFKPYRPGMLRYFKGNMKMFGWWAGFWSALYCVCPALNTIRFWKYRKHRLVLPDDIPGGPTMSDSTASCAIAALRGK